MAFYTERTAHRRIDLRLSMAGRLDAAVDEVRRERISCNNGHRNTGDSVVAAWQPQGDKPVAPTMIHLGLHAGSWEELVIRQRVGTPDDLANGLMGDAVGPGEHSQTFAGRVAGLDLQPKIGGQVGS